jgi:hypothetical protein
MTGEPGMIGNLTSLTVNYAGIKPQIYMEQNPLFLTFISYTIMDKIYNPLTTGQLKRYGCDYLSKCETLFYYITLRLYSGD